MSTIGPDTTVERSEREVHPYEALAHQLRVDSVRMGAEAGSGHPTSSMSAAELMAVLMERFLHYDFADPGGPGNDRLIFSKGHASPLLYAMAKAAGAIADDEMLTFRRKGSRLEGHPTPRFPSAQVATGSLGQGLGIGVGMALAAKRLDRVESNVYVLLGDSEMAEGSVWEAIDKAGFYDLDNLVAVVDMNRLGQRGPTELEWDGDAYVRRAEAFGWSAVHIDGHDVDAVEAAYGAALESDRPSMIVGRTVKGKGVSFLEDTSKWHGKAPTGDRAEQALDELGRDGQVRVRVAPPRDVRPAVSKATRPTGEPEFPSYPSDGEVATRDAFGDALAALGAVYPDLVVLDGELGDSTRTLAFADAHPDRFFQMYIAEQQMVAAAMGMSALGYRPFAATFAAFMTRAYDFVRMAAVSRANLRLAGSHAGVAIGEDGPSQMGLEDLAMMRAVHGSTVLYPCDPYQTVRLTEAMMDLEGVAYLRTTRGDTPVIYGAGDAFEVGGSRTLRSSADDAATVVAAGVTVHEALAAARTLAGEGVGVRVIDAYSVKPFDAGTLRSAFHDTGGRLVVAEDHRPEGGLGEAALAALAADGIDRLRIRHLAVRHMPGSATSDEQLEAAGIGRRAIAAAVRELAA